jgi:hypothetical protein
VLFRDGDRQAASPLAASPGVRMTSYELGNLIKDRLRAAGLAQYLDEAREQYLEFPDGFFAEVVLKDGSKLSEARRILTSVEEELRKQGVELNAIVRAEWEVESVERAGMAPVPGGSERLEARLRSGDGKCEVAVIVTPGASQTIYAASKQGGLKEYGQYWDAAMVELGRQFLRLELSYGGESYWDPILHPELTLNESALEYLTMHDPARAG